MFFKYTLQLSKNIYIPILFQIPSDYHFLKTDNVLMLDAEKDGNLSECAYREAVLFPFHPHLFQCNHLLRLSVPRPICNNATLH
jgi:hypothetical protein